MVERWAHNCKNLGYGGLPLRVWAPHCIFTLIGIAQWWSAGLTATRTRVMAGSHCEYEPQDLTWHWGCHTENNSMQRCIASGLAENKLHKCLDDSKTINHISQESPINYQRITYVNRICDQPQRFGRERKMTHQQSCFPRKAVSPRPNSHYIPMPWSLSGVL